MPSKTAKQIDDEINLIDLIESIWKEKVLIIVMIAVTSLIGLGYARLTPSIYEAKVEILPPFISNIAELHKFDILKFSNTNSLTRPQQQLKVFEDFISILKSNQILQKLLQEEGVMESLNEKDITQHRALKKLNEMVNIGASKNDTGTGVSIKVQSFDAELAAKFANQLVDLAKEQYRKNISLAFDSEKDQRIKELKLTKSSLIYSHEARLNQEITKLKEAYLIAQKLDIIEPKESIGRSLFSNAITNELRYLYSQGTIALDAEIKTINQLKKNHKLVDGLIDIEQRLSLFKNTPFDVSKVNPINIDLAAEIPEIHIKPKRTLIVLLSGAIGGILAIMFLLIRNIDRNHKA